MLSLQTKIISHNLAVALECLRSDENGDALTGSFFDAILALREVREQGFTTESIDNILKLSL